MNRPLTVQEAGRKGGNARVAAMTTGQRQEAGKAAAKARWGAVRKRACPLCGRPLGHGRLKVEQPGPEKASRRMVHEGCLMAKRFKDAL